MAFIDGYKGKTAPAIALIFKGDTVPGSAAGKTERDHVYWIKNKNLSKFVITGQAAGRTYVWTRETSDKNPYWNEQLKEYTLPPVAADDINALVDNPRTVWKIDLDFSYYLFLDHLLYYMTKLDSADLSNFAKPAAPVDKDVILRSLICQQEGNRVTAQYVSTSVHYDNIPITLSDKSAVNGPNNVPAIRLTFQLDFIANLDQTKKDLMRKLMAMDYSRLLGTKEGPSTELGRLWRDNLVTYLITHTNPNRGKSMINEIKQTCLGYAGDRQVFTAHLRGEIDDRMITANHWRQRREDSNREKYQSICSDVFGTILETAPWASPVKLLRRIEDTLHLVDRDSRAFFQLQYGVGHCGEHSNLAFVLLRDMASQANIQYIVATGNANIDHEFTIYDLPVTAIYNVIAQNPNNGAHKPGSITSALKVFDLNKSILDYYDTHQPMPVTSGWVVDAYLDTSEQPMIGADLLRHLDSRQRRAEGRDTHYLEYYDYFSRPPSSPTVINTQPHVKNV